MESCVICNIQFSNKRGLANHLRAKHSLLVEDYKATYLGLDKPLLIEGEDYVCCPLCSKPLRTLKKHLMVRHGYSAEKATACSVSCSSYKAKAKAASSLGAKAQHEKYSDRSSFRNESSRLQTVSQICKTSEFSKKMSEIMVLNWQNPDYRKTTSKAIKDSANQDWLKQKRSLMFQDADYRRKCLNRNNAIIVSDSQGNQYVLRSHWEVSVFDWLVANKVSFEYETLSISYQLKDSKHLYIPDFYLPKANLILEIHPAIRIDEIMQAKAQACLDQGYCFEFLDKADITDLKLTNLVSFYTDLYADNISVASSYGKRMTNSDFYAACKITRFSEPIQVENTVMNP